MKILFIRSANPFLESSAAGNRYAGLINGLIALGCSVILVVTGGFNSMAEFKTRKKYGNHKNLTIKHSVFWFNNTLFLYRIKKYVLDGFFTFISGLMLKKEIKSASYDFIWVTANGSILQIFNKYHKLINGKSIIELNEFNDIYKAESHISSKLQFKKADQENEIFLKAVKKIDLFLVMTQTLIEHYKKLASPDAVFFHLPMTVDLSRFFREALPSSLKKPYIAFTGTFNNAKDGVDVLIWAFSEIAKRYPHHLYLAGFNHWDVDGQKKMIRSFMLENRITYLGVLDKNVIPSFITNADLLVLPRPDSHQARGGFPTKLGEYLATGKPVCVTNVGEIPDYLKDNFSAFLAEPGSVSSFVSAMNRALTDIKFAGEVGLNGKKVAQTVFNIDVQSARLIDFLRSHLKD